MIDRTGAAGGPTMGGLPELLDLAQRLAELGGSKAQTGIARAVADLRAALDAPASIWGGLAPWQVRRIDLFIDANLQRRLRAETMSREVRLSPTHFSRAFKRSFGESPHAFVIGRRVARAQRLMLDSDLPLALIAIATGFADQAHFSRLFRERTGQTPAAWRRNHLSVTIEPRRAAA